MRSDLCLARELAIIISYALTGVVSWASAVLKGAKFSSLTNEKMESVPSSRTNALARFCIPCLTRRSTLIVANGSSQQDVLHRRLIVSAAAYQTNRSLKRVP